MNDFFNEGNETALSASDEQEIRAKIQAEVFEGIPAKFEDDPQPTSTDLGDVSTPGTDDSTPKTDESQQEEKEVTSEVTPEVIPDVVPLSPEMQAIVDSVNKLTSSITGMEDRVKQTERRVGSMSNEFHAAKLATEEAAATQAKAPTPEAVAEAAKNEQAWEDLKKDFPSWATAIDSKIKTQTTNFVSVDDFEALRKSVSETPSVDTSQLEARLVGIIHPDHKQIVNDPAYATWLNVQSDEVKFKAYKGTTAEQAIDVFNLFKAQKTAPAPDADPGAVSEVQQIKAKAKERLAASTTTNTNHKTIKPKAEADMTDAELRQKIAAEVFDK